MTKTQKLLLRLIYSGREGVERSRLVEDLYGREDVVDIANNLRVTIHRLKQFLLGIGVPEWDYIESDNGIYRWSGPMKTEVDALVFQELIQKADETDARKERIAYLKRACGMYNGDFLRDLSGEEWVLIESVRYKNLYVRALSEVCEYLMECQEYEEAIKLCTPACEMYPLDEWQCVRMECYIGLNRFEDAYKEYEATSKLMFEELGISPSKKMLDQLKSMGERMNGTPGVIHEIQAELQEEREETGAFYCSLPSFRDEYRFVRRIMEREGQSVYLMLCTLTDSKGYLQQSKERLEKMSVELREALRISLRRCDSFTRYNAAQFLVLLMGTDGESCSQIFERITRCFAKNHKTWTNYLECRVVSVAGLERGGSEIVFESRE